MNDPLIVTIVTVALIALSALFVVIEFALLGATSGVVLSGVAIALMAPV